MFISNISCCCSTLDLSQKAEKRSCCSKISIFSQVDPLLIDSAFVSIYHLRHCLAWLPLSGVGEKHGCKTVTFQLGTPHPDLKDIGVYNPDLILCVDGSPTENKQ